MRVTIEIPLQQIDCQKKPAFNKKVLLFALKMLRGYTFPPISVAKSNNGRYRLTQGRHRFSALRLIGRKTTLVNLGIPQDPNPDRELSARKVSTPLPKQAKLQGLNPTPKE